MVIKGLICYSIENFSHFFAISGNILLHKVAKNGNYLPYYSSCQKWQYLLTSKLPKMATICCVTIVAKNGNKMVDLLLYRETSVTFLPFLAIFCFSVSKNACQKLPKMAIFIDLKVAKNGK